MSRLSREHPDDPEMWANPAVPIPAFPPPCKCSHSESQHTRSKGQCWSPVCGCRSFRPKEQSQ